MPFASRTTPKRLAGSWQKHSLGMTRLRLLLESPPVEFEEYVKIYSLSAGRDGLTIIARNASTGARAGALITEDATSPPPPGIEQVSEKFDPIFDLLGQLDENYRDDRTVRPGECMHLLLLGVAEEFARLSIGQHLVKICLDNGAA
jgi:hypothetical protein